MAGRGRGTKKRDVPAEQLQSSSSAGRGSYAQMGGGAASAPQPQAARPPAASAWGPPPGASSRATHRAPEAQPGDLAAPMGQMNLGRPQVAADAPQRGGGGAAGAPVPRNGQAGAAAAAPAGRGSVRGGRVITQEVLRTRPAQLATKQGKLVPEGRHAMLLANYFKINTVPDWTLHQYRVDVEPEEDRTHERRFLLRAHKPRLGGYLFDGTVLFTANRLTTPQNPVLTLTSSNRDESAVFTLKVRHVGEVAFGDYAYVQVYNLLLRTCIKALNLQLVGRDYYDPTARIEIREHGLELWPGYKTSIRQHESGILMCVEIAFKVLRLETVYDVLANCHRQYRDDYKREFVKEVVGCIVLTKYNNKTYRIDDVNWDQNPGSTFDYKGEQTSYAQYMQLKYQLTIRDLKQPMLVSRAKARDVRAGMAEIINLIPEVCYCTGITDNMRANFRLMSAMAEHTRVGPDNRVRKLQALNQRLRNCPEATEKLRDFQMTLDSDLVKIKGQTFPPQVILLGNKKVDKTRRPADWTSELQGASLLVAQELTNWIVLVTARFRNDAESFVQMIQRVGQGMRFRVNPPTIEILQRDNAAGFAQQLGQILDRAQPQLIMCVSPGKKVDVYSAIKKKCCVDKPVPTQVMVCKNLNNPKSQMSIATKVAIQLSCKIGGAPWSVTIPVKELMIVGFDVCHDTASKNRSFGAMVASLDQNMTRYFSAVTPHESGDELSNNFGLNLVKAVRKYQSVSPTGSPPKSIIIYRDGVGEGQIGQVVTTEVESIKARLAEVYGGEQVKMTFVIVTKRINTRLFTDRLANPPPGTIADDVITDPEKYDFFLVSQSVNQGSVSPTSYNVISDSLNLPAERLQLLTFRLCHLYFNWSGTVRVPAPCQYAHKLAFLVGQALHREPAAALEDLLYFL